MHIPNPLRFLRRDRTLANGASNFMILGNGKFITTDSVNTEKAMQNSDVFAVINRISSDIAACHFSSPQYQQLLDDPFRLMNSYSGWQSIMIQLLLFGNAYVVMHRNNNQIVELEPVPSSDVELTLLSKARDIIYKVHYTDEREDQTYTSSDMLHFKLVTPGQDTNQYTGVSPLMSLVPELGIQDRSHKLMLASLLHAIAPTNIYETPSALTEPNAKQKIREEFEKVNGGDNAGKILVMDAGAKLETIDITPNVANLLQNTTFSQTQIAKAFGVPDSYLNGQGDQQSSIEMIRSIYQNALTMYIRPLESELTKKLNTPVKLNIGDTIDVDGQNLINNVDTLVKDGVMTPEQALSLMIARDIMPGLKIGPNDLPLLNSKFSSSMKGGEKNDGNEESNT